MSRKKDRMYVDGFNVCAILKLLESHNTPKWVKRNWEKRLKKAGWTKDKIKKIKDIS